MKVHLINGEAVELPNGNALNYDDPWWLIVLNQEDGRSLEVARFRYSRVSHILPDDIYVNKGQEAK